MTSITKIRANFTPKNPEMTVSDLLRCFFIYYSFDHDPTRDLISITHPDITYASHSDRLTAYSKDSISVDQMIYAL
jgi:hypothetical protein